MNAGKTTSPGWPDPTDWLNRLEQNVRTRGEEYLSISNQRNREPGSYSDEGDPIEAGCTLAAASVLSALTAALDELPIFHKHPAKIALNDLVFALHDLATGGSPTLLRRGVRRADVSPISHLTVVGYAALSLRLLKHGHGYSDIAARREVAKIFSASGIRGRKGGLLSASTLQDWQDKFDGLPPDDIVKQSIERHWSLWTSDPGWQSGQNLALALEWIRKLAEQPDIRNKAADPLS